MLAGETMNDENEIRLMANELMRRLYEMNAVEQLEILESYARAAIEQIKNKSRKPWPKIWRG